MRPVVLFDARLALNRPTGIGQYCASLIKELIHVAPDWHFRLLRGPNPWPGYGLATLESPNLSHHVSRLRHMSPFQYWHVPRMAERVGADIVHYPHFDAPVLHRPVPVVVTVHDTKYLVHPEFFTDFGRLKRGYMRLAFSLSLRRADAIIAVSEATKSDLSQLPAAKGRQIDVIYSAASPRFGPASDEEKSIFRTRYGIPRPYVLSVGERRPHKNHVALIRAYARSRSRRTHDLLIVGRPYGGFRGPEEAVDEHRLEGRVHLIDYLDFDGLVAAYSASSLFVLISLYEGFGLPILEAMACGTPVLASATTAAAEITGNGGVTVDPSNEEEIASAVDAILLDNERSGALSAKARRWAKHFSWKRTADQTLVLYERTLSRSPG